MNNAINNVVIYNGYPASVVVAIFFHCAVLATLVYFQGSTRTEVLQLVQPTVIKSLFIEENPQVSNQRAQERRRLERIEQQDLARQQEQQEQQRQADAEAERQRQRERDSAAEQQRQEQARLDQAQADRQRADQQREADRRSAEEQAAAERRNREDAQRRERELTQARENERQRDVAEAAAAEAASSEFELVQSATALIQQLVQGGWSRPPSARNGMRVIIQIRMFPTGELNGAPLITQSSGDAAFDRAAEDAVYRAAPFRELQNLPTNIFNANFRTLSLIFQPEDLLN